MSIVQTAETIEAYNEKIASLESKIEELEKHRKTVCLRCKSGCFGALLFVFGSFGLMLCIPACSKCSSEPEGEGRTVMTIFLVLGLIFLTLAGVCFHFMRVANDKTKFQLKQIDEELSSYRLTLSNTINRKDAIVSGIVAITNKDVHAERQAAATVEQPVIADMATKTCPMCAENIKAAAKKCRFCGHLFE